MLIEDGLIPSTVEEVADFGFGGGGGTIALADVYPKAIVTAIDNASTQQLRLRYVRRDLPRWSGRIEVVEEDARIAARRLGSHDLVLASRPNMADPRKTTTWEEDSLFKAENFIALAEMTELQSGTALVGYNPEEDPGVLNELTKRVDASKLFNELVRYGVENGDEWLVLSGVNQAALAEAKENPKILLTSVGKKEPSYVELQRIWRNADGS